VLPGTVGLIMATEAIKLILGKGEPLIGRLMLYDSLRMSFRDVRIRKDPKCELCGEHPTITELIDYQTFCAVELPAPKAAEAPAELDPRAVEVNAADLKTIIDSGRRITLLDVREPHEWEINRIEPARLTPLSQFEQFIPELNPDDDIYLYCYKGKRSLTALKQLQARGFKHLHSLAGGIDRWAQEVDPKMARY
jgi:sulfur-carrier protein adenylyltransferase/sulfurtransferase